METTSGTEKLTRSFDDRVLAGVCGGLGSYLNVESVWIRIGFVVGSLFWGIGLLVYALLWVTLPEQSDEDGGDPGPPLATGNPRAVAGVVLLTLGLLIVLWKVLDFLFDRVLSHISFGFVLAVALIGIGLFLLFNRQR